MPGLISHAFEGHAVRIVMRDDEPWFVAIDVCAALTIVNGRDALAKLDADEKGVAQTDTLGGTQNVSVISESGLYRLVMRSDKPEAKRFQKWVTREVLPSIRKTGSFGAPDPLATLNDPAALRTLLLGYTEKVLALEATVGAQTATIAELAPKAATHDALMESSDTYGFRAAVKVLHKTVAVTESEVRTLMIARGWIQRLDGALAPKSYGEAQGYVTARVTEYSDSTGETRSRSELRITNRGLARLQKLLEPRRKAA